MVSGVRTDLPKAVDHCMHKINSKQMKQSKTHAISKLRYYMYNVHVHVGVCIFELKCPHRITIRRHLTDQYGAHPN